MEMVVPGLKEMIKRSYLIDLQIERSHMIEVPTSKSISESERFLRVLLAWGERYWKKETRESPAGSSLRQDVLAGRYDTRRSLHQLMQEAELELFFRFDLELQRIADILRLFHALVLSIQPLPSDFEKLLSLLARISCPLLLCFALLGFPNRLRPPCTTMPWTIWPALVVLWGVCWMFYEGNYWDWVSLEAFPADSNINNGINDVGVIGSFQGDFPPLCFLALELTLFLLYCSRFQSWRLRLDRDSSVECG